MQNRVRAVASVITVGVFIYFAMASFGSTNTSVVVTECKPKLDYTSSLLIDIGYFDDGEPIEGAHGSIFLVHQVIQDTMTCQSLVLSSETIPFTTNGQGYFIYNTPSFTHSNSGDLWRVEVYIPAVPGSYMGGRKLNAAKYNNDFLSIRFEDIPEL